MMSGGKRILIVGIAAPLLLLAILVYYKYNPASVLWFPQCPIKQLTGWSCPACGFQRATHALLNGRFEEALSYNYFYVIGLPYLSIVALAYGFKKFNKWQKMAELFESRVLAMLYVFCFFAWFLMRNILEI